MNYAILATEIFGLLVIIDIIYGVWFESAERSQKKKAFMALLSSAFLTVALDIIVYLPVDWNKHITLYYVFVMAGFIAPFVVYSFFLQYIFLHISKKAKVSKIPFIIGVCYCSVGILFSIYYGLKGSLFTVTGGTYLTGDYYEGYMLTYVVVIAYTIVLVCVYEKKIGLHDCIAAIMFMFIPIIAVLVNIAFPECAFSVAALAFAMLVIDTMLQGERESKLIESHIETTKLAHSDELTGLLNRLAFMENCDRMNSDEQIGVVFSDVNGLKYTNDHYGHKAGDKLLCDYANILLSCFRKDDVYRISGDEFVVLLKGMPKETFDRKTKDLINKINSGQMPVAAAGFMHGSQSEISRLLDMAEAAMYEDKKVFYKNYPTYGRSTAEK